MVEYATPTIFDEYLRRWNLMRAGGPIITPSSELLPVLHDGLPAMLKVAKTEEEERGNRLMAWWAGEGTAAVLAQDGPALLMERAMGRASLADMARSGRDEEATRLICRAANGLHASNKGLPELTRLEDWFADLAPAAIKHGGILVAAAAVARDLLASQPERKVLHGDIHHGNVLDFGKRGWRAIDPKGLLGERTFDFVNILRNPTQDVATTPGRLARHAAFIAEETGLDRNRLLQWTVAFAGLSAAWLLAEGDDPHLDLRVAEIASVALAQV